MAAQLGALGLDPMRYIESTDSDERYLMTQLGQQIYDFRRDLDHNLAVDIANAVGKVFKG